MKHTPLKSSVIFCLLILICSLFTMAGCQSETTEEPSDSGPNSIEFFAMDTIMEIRGYGADDTFLSEASEAVIALEKRISTTEENSEISSLNHTSSGNLSHDTVALLKDTLDLCKKTDGNLDISVYPIVKAWGFTTQEYQVPPAEDLRTLLKKVGYERIQILSDDSTVILPEGMEIDLGAIAKGYTGDMLAQMFRDHGISSALFNLGGNVQTVGSKPGNTPWLVAIQDPEALSEEESASDDGAETNVNSGILGAVPVMNKAVVTSGGYERFFEGDDGTIYWHIMDPATGYPAKNGLISVTIIGDSGIYCDALSTALFIMGEDKAIDFWRKQGDFEMALVTDDGRMLLSEGIADSFQPSPTLRYPTETVWKDETEKDAD